MERFINYKFSIWVLSCLCVMTSCNDNYPDVDGEAPDITLISEHIESAPGHRISIAGNVADNDGLISVRLVCPDLFLDKTIDLIDIFGEPQKSYSLDYGYDLKRDEIGERFTIKVIATDVAGRTFEKEVVVTMDGDFESPVFTSAPDSEITVLLKSKTEFSLRFTVADDRMLDYVIIDIPGISDYDRQMISAEGNVSFTYECKVPLPGIIAEYEVSIEAVDKRGNSTTTRSKLFVSEMPDFPKMYLADVSTVEELNSDVFGVPMVIEHVGEFRYNARYYNQAPGTEVLFIPQRSDFSPICFGINPDDPATLSDDPSVSKPFVLDEANVYYEINLDLKESTYSMHTYSVGEATDPIPLNYKYDTKCFDRWENGGEDWIDFFIGWGNSPQDAGNHKFAMDKNNPHLFIYPSDNNPWILESGQVLDFIVTNWHPDNWWDHVEWRADTYEDIEKFGYFSKKGDVNPDWEGVNMQWHDGTPVKDNWFKAKVLKGGAYRFEFDAHLGRGKIVPAN